ncbi:MAG: hypothetical protein DMF03_02865 [Verrucomicrobia bacterium]|nr:MAG: hypothetical protein DMF03_02865 [Verrucomicrobiota bacterium]
MPSARAWNESFNQHALDELSMPVSQEEIGFCGILIGNVSVITRASGLWLSDSRVNKTNV